MAQSLRRPRPRVLALAGAIGIVLYLSLDVVLVYLRPEFSVLHNAESDYGSTGHWAWVMDLNFLLRCALSIAIVLAIAQVTAPHGRLRTGLVLLGIWAITSGLLAFFPDDPAGTVARGAGKIHVALAAVAFIAVAVGTRLTTRALRTFERWRRAVPTLAVLSYGAFVPVLLLGKSHLRPHSLGGLYEKIFLGVELMWFAVAASWILADQTVCAREDSNPRPTA